MFITLRHFTSIFLLFIVTISHAAVEVTVDSVLQREEVPDGVVFEIVQGQENALEWAIPLIQADTKRLRERFPKIHIAVVSHGKEEFALLRENATKYSKVHSAVRQLTLEDDVPVHVCGTHASWYDKQDEDFPDYVDVAPAGPAQINNYRSLGYVWIVVKKPR